MRAAPSVHMPTPTRDTAILLVAEHALVRAGLRAVLGGTPGLAVVAEAPDLRRAVALASRHQPDVVLLGQPPADEADAAALHTIRREAASACVLCLGAGATAGDGGALPCVPRDAGMPEFCRTLGLLLGGRCGACRLRDQCPVPRLAAALTPREREVAVRVAAGLSSKQIAAALGVGLRTVNTYRESLARKIGASSPAVITRYVLTHGLNPEQAVGPG